MLNKLKILLVYKGRYNATLKGPEMRYIALARALNSQGYEVSVAGYDFDTTVHSGFLNFIPINNLWQVFKAFMRSDCVVLHGGGPFLLMLSLLIGFFGKSTVLDNYVPHWVELDEVMKNQGRTTKLEFKSAFNVFRSLMGLLTFNMVIVANRRQQDLLRGMIAPFLRTQGFDRIEVIPFGCEPYTNRSREEGVRLLNSLAENSRLQSTDFLVGWLGGTYGWFDLSALLASMKVAFERNPAIKLVFFGVNEKQREEMLECIPVNIHGNLIFLPWVSFQERFAYWAAFDISLVWGGDGYENDYASRTRNFDCLSLGLPVIQNEDDEWGVRLKSSGAGMITSLESVSDDLLWVSQNEKALQKMHTAMKELAPEFYWERFSEHFASSVNRNKMSLLRRLTGALALMFVLPGIALFFLFGLLSR